MKVDNQLKAKGLGRPVQCIQARSDAAGLETSDRWLGGPRPLR